MRKPGRIKTKMAQRLSEELTKKEGFQITIDPEDLWTQQGDYRKATWDLARWGALKKTVNPKGINLHFSIHSWDTMTECLKKGFTVEGPGHKDLPGVREVVAL